MRSEVKLPRRVATSVAAGFPIQRPERDRSPAPKPTIDARACGTSRPGGWSRLWREIRHNDARWLCLLIAIGAGLALSSRVNRSGLLWSEVGLAWRDALYLVLPWTGAVAAWTAGRERRHGLDELLATTARSSFRRRLSGWSAVSALGIAAYLVVGCWLVLIAANRASGGRIDPGPIIAGLMAIPAFAALGFALGAWQPRRATAFAALLGFGFVQIVFAQAKGWTAYLTATPALVHASSHGIAPDLSAQQIGFFLGLTGLGLALLARVSARSWAIRGALAASTLVVLLAAASLAGHRAEVRAARTAPTAGQAATSQLVAGRPSFADMNGRLRFRVE